MVKPCLPTTRSSRLEGDVFIFRIILESPWEPNNLIGHSDFGAGDFGALFVLAVHLYRR